MKSLCRQSITSGSVSSTSTTACPCASLLPVPSPPTPPPPPTPAPRRPSVLEPEPSGLLCAPLEQRLFAHRSLASAPSCRASARPPCSASPSSDDTHTPEGDVPDGPGFGGACSASSDDTHTSDHGRASPAPSDSESDDTCGVPDGLGRGSGDGDVSRHAAPPLCCPLSL